EFIEDVGLGCLPSGVLGIFARLAVGVRARHGCGSCKGDAGTRDAAMSRKRPWYRPRRGGRRTGRAHLLRNEATVIGRRRERTVEFRWPVVTGRSSVRKLQRSASMPSIELLPPGVTPESTLLAPDGVPRPEAHAGAAEAGLDLVPYRLWAVVNPGAGTAEPAMAVAKLKERYGDFTLFEPRSGADFDAFAERLESELRQGDGPDCVVAAGGDGTVSGVASALWRTKKKLSSEEEAVPGRMAPRLAILPMGTANVLARELGITGTLDESCEL